MSVPTVAAGELIDRAAGATAVDPAILLAPTGALLVVAPHPDDETLGCGAAIAATLAAGRSVSVVLLTDGENSHPRSASHPRDSLAALRRRELGAALATLAAGTDAAPPRVHALHLPDAGVPSSGEAAADAAGRIAAIAEAEAAGTIWCTWRGDPHCDHTAAAILCDHAQRRLATPILRRDYAVWGRFGAGLPAGDRLLVVPPGGHRSAKAAAMAHYRSQLTPLIEDDPEGFVMPPALVAHFAAAPELFIAERGR